MIVPDYWAQALASLRERDPIMTKLIQHYADGCLQSRADPFFTLARSIVGQQISIKAAESIWQRLCACVHEVTPSTLTAASDEQLRNCGLSRSKVLYLRHLLTQHDAGRLDLTRWQHCDDQAVIDDLTQIKGIGRWSAEMFLMFCLLRPNILPVTDLGLLRAIAYQYAHDTPLSVNWVREHAQRCWQPWCSVATWFLWRSLDPVAVYY